MKTILCLLLTLLMLAALPARADAPRGAVVQLKAYRIVALQTAKGVRETLEPLNELRPGDTVEYEAAYVNGTGQTVHDVHLTIPVPEGGLVYKGATSLPPQAATLDGKQYAALPLTRVETEANGQRVARPVPLAEYKALRWNLGDVPSGTTRIVRARMQLPALPAAASSVSR
jgi:hypothetical protein